MSVPNFRNNECGATAVEYGFVAAIIAALLIAGVNVAENSVKESSPPAVAENVE